MSSKNGIADQLGNLRDYGVSEGGNSVWNFGNPIISSTSRGLGNTGSSGPFRKTSRKLLKQVPLPKYRPLGLPLLSALFVGVGKYPNSVPSMPGAKVGSWYAVPLRIIPDLGQVSENSAKPSSPLFAWATKQVCDVLQHSDARSYVANEADDIAVKAAACSTTDASLSAGNADILTREATTDRVDSNSIGSKSLCGEFSNVMVAGNLRPMLGEDTAGKFLDLAERDSLETARALQTKAETADARKQVKKFEGLHSPLPQQCGGGTMTAPKVAPAREESFGCRGIGPACGRDHASRIPDMTGVASGLAAAMIGVVDDDGAVPENVAATAYGRATGFAGVGHLCGSTRLTQMPLNFATVFVGVASMTVGHRNRRVRMLGQIALLALEHAADSGMAEDAASVALSDSFQCGGEPLALHRSIPSVNENDARGVLPGRVATRRLGRARHADTGALI